MPRSILRRKTVLFEFVVRILGSGPIKILLGRPRLQRGARPKIAQKW